MNEHTIFTAPEEQGTAEKAGWWSKAQQSKHIPSSYTRAILLTIDVALLMGAGLIGFRTHAPLIIMVGLELLYLGTCALFLLARTCQRFFPAIGIYLVVIGLGMILNLAFPGTWGDVAFFLFCVTVLYRFPPAWSLLLAGLGILALITTNGSLPVFPVRPPDTGWTLPTSLALAGLLCGVGWSRRRQMDLILTLQQTQALLREQTRRAEELAAEQERARIARDIHDVLSHTLSVLSIQVQAARHLRTRDPERLATKLDEMATLIRESITESRRVIGVLREPPPPPSGQDDLGARLRLIATTFNERTGIHCHFDESGLPHKVSPQQRETLELALREMLTNAHRHGAARMVWITVQWREASIILEAQDDGMSTSATQPGISGDDETDHGDGGHHGLQGMSERAAALCGEVEAGPTVSGGFMVSMRLPFEQPNEKAAQRGKEA